MIPGEIILSKSDITINSGKQAISIDVVNTGDRPIQIGSHFHFFEANKRLTFDRSAAYGRRLDIPSGTAVRFEPKSKATVALVEIGGRRNVYGANSRVQGNLDENKHAALSGI